MIQGINTVKTCRVYRGLVEFSVQYPGGRRIFNSLRDSKNVSQGTGGSLRKNHLKLINTGGQSEPTCNRQHAGYTVKSGVLRSLSPAQYILSKDKKFNLFTDSPQWNLIPCPLSTDGNALKPSIEFDSRLKIYVGPDIPVDIAFIEKNPEITLEFLQKHVVTEVVF